MDIVKDKDQLLINGNTRTIEEGDSVVIKKDDKYSIKEIEDKVYTRDLFRRD